MSNAHQICHLALYCSLCKICTALEIKKERASYLGFDLISEWMTKLSV